MNAGHFRKGHDPRKHLLTTDERRKGGITSCLRFLALYRLEMNLPLPTSDLRRIAAKFLLPTGK